MRGRTRWIAVVVEAEHAASCSAPDGDVKLEVEREPLVRRQALVSRLFHAGAHDLKVFVGAIHCGEADAAALNPCPCLVHFEQRDVARVEPERNHLPDRRRDSFRVWERDEGASCGPSRRLYEPACGE